MGDRNLRLLRAIQHDLISKLFLFIKFILDRGAEYKNLKWDFCRI